MYCHSYQPLHLSFPALPLFHFIPFFSIFLFHLLLNIASASSSYFLLSLLQPVFSFFILLFVHHQSFMFAPSLLFSCSFSSSCHSLFSFLSCFPCYILPRHRCSPAVALSLPLPPIHPPPPPPSLEVPSFSYTSKLLLTHILSSQCCQLLQKKTFLSNLDSCQGSLDAFSANRPVVMWFFSPSSYFVFPSNLQHLLLYPALIPRFLFQFLFDNTKHKLVQLRSDVKTECVFQCEASRDIVLFQK